MKSSAQSPFTFLEKGFTEDDLYFRGSNTSGLTRDKVILELKGSHFERGME